MKNAKVDEVIKVFVEHGRIGISLRTPNRSLMHDRGILVNYSTIIGIKVSSDLVLLNKDKYSVTTSKNQNKVKRLCQSMNIDVIEVSEKDINRLEKDFLEGKNAQYLLELLA